jgi:hypothetical protein
MSAAVEISLIYGGTLSIGANGDIAISQDTPGSPQATFERVLRIVMTNPIQFDDTGAPVVAPDNLFDTGFGAGVKDSIGENFTTALQKGVNSRIIAACNADPYIVNNSTSVVWTQGQLPGEWSLVLSFTPVGGQPFTSPPIPFPFTSYTST